MPCRGFIIFIFTRICLHIVTKIRQQPKAAMHQFVFYFFFTFLFALWHFVLCSFLTTDHKSKICHEWKEQLGTVGPRFCFHDFPSDEFRIDFYSRLLKRNMSQASGNTYTMTLTNNQYWLDWDKIWRTSCDQDFLLFSPLVLHLCFIMKCINKSSIESHEIWGSPDFSLQMTCGKYSTISSVFIKV